MKKEEKEVVQKKHFYSNPGSPIVDKYGSHIAPNGDVIVEVTGKEDLYSYIQSFAESCDIHVILKKFLAGDESVLNQRVGAFIDTTDYPTNLADFLNLTNKAKDLFATLPVEIKERFDNDENKFITSLGTDDFINKLKLDPKVMNEEVKTQAEEVQTQKDI